VRRNVATQSNRFKICRQRTAQAEECDIKVVIPVLNDSIAAVPVPIALEFAEVHLPSRPVADAVEGRHRQSVRDGEYRSPLLTRTNRS
jgi:hypothetical protein